ncbi:hypothetical protein ACERCG_05765 [Mannheimia sp. E30BD]|uniref:hypothetical protein n=1 Tax=Mannheimia sp. E30BD TaxID=3278708 RepID=UPI00359DD6AE
MAKDDELLHPIIREGLAKARQRVKYYKEKGLITLENGAVSIFKLAERQRKDFIARQQRNAKDKALQQLQAHSKLVGKI